MSILFPAATTASRRPITHPLLMALGLALVGFSVSAGGVLRLAAFGATAALAFALLLNRPTAVVSLAVFVSLFPWPPRLEPAVPVLGGTVYLADLLVAMAAVTVLTRLRREPVSVVPVLLAAWIVMVGAVVGLGSHNAMSGFMRDLRGPVYLMLGVAIGEATLSSPPLFRALARSLSVVLWASTVGVLLTLVSGIGLVGGKVGEVSTNLSGVYTAFDAVRFRIAPTQVALIVLCVVIGCAVVRPPGVDMGSLLARFGAPSLMLTFLSFSRSALVAVALTVATCGAASWGWRRVVSFVGRLAAAVIVASSVVAVVVVASDVFSGASGSERNPVRRQLSAYQARVLDVLSSDKLAQDSSAAFRRLENNYALAFIGRHPVAGGGFGAVYRPLLPYEPFAEGTGVTYAHNYYLWTMLKTGAMGMAAMVVLFCAPLLRALPRLSRGAAHPLLVPLLAALLGVLGVLYVEPVARARESAAAFGCMLGMLWWMVSAGAGTEEPQTASATPRTAKEAPGVAV